MNDGTHTTIHLQHQLNGLDEPNRWTFRIVIPGLDEGGAVWFESTVERKTQAEALVLMRECIPHLQKVLIDICECQKSAAGCPAALAENMKTDTRCEAETQERFNHPSEQCRHQALPKSRYCGKHQNFGESLMVQILRSLPRWNYPLAELNPRIAYRENYDHIKWR